MLINKSDFIRAGIPAKTAAIYSNLLNRRMAGVTIPPSLRRKGRGRSPTRSFDLNYAKHVVQEMLENSDGKVKKHEWEELMAALEKIHPKIDWMKHKGEPFSRVMVIYRVDLAEAVRQYAEFKARGGNND